MAKTNPTATKPGGRGASKVDDRVVRTFPFARFVNVVDRKSGADPFRVQIVLPTGRLEHPVTTEALFLAVLGDQRQGDQSVMVNYGLRQLMHVKFRALLNDAGVMVGVDIVPRRMFPRGTAPVRFGKNLDEGFPIAVNEGYAGFRVPECCTQVDETQLNNLLDALREHKWNPSRSATATFEKFKVNRESDGRSFRAFLVGGRTNAPPLPSRS